MAVNCSVISTSPHLVCMKHGEEPGKRENFAIFKLIITVFYTLVSEDVLRTKKESHT